MPAAKLGDTSRPAGPARGDVAIPCSATPARRSRRSAVEAVSAEGRASTGVPPPAARGLALDAERLAFRRAGQPRHRSCCSTPPSASRSWPRPGAAIGCWRCSAPRSGTFYLGAGFDAGARRAFAPLLDRASHGRRRRRRHGGHRPGRRAPGPRLPTSWRPLLDALGRAEPELPRSLRPHGRPRRRHHPRRPPASASATARWISTLRSSGSPSSSRRRSARPSPSTRAPGSARAGPSSCWSPCSSALGAPARRQSSTWAARSRRPPRPPAHAGLPGAPPAQRAARRHRPRSSCSPCRSRSTGRRVPSQP